jgi:hypothetical protein
MEEHAEALHLEQLANELAEAEAEAEAESIRYRADNIPVYTLGDFRSTDSRLRSCRDWKLLSY